MTRSARQVVGHVSEGGAQGVCGVLGGLPGAGERRDGAEQVFVDAAAGNRAERGHHIVELIGDLAQVAGRLVQDQAQSPGDVFYR
ncbi:MAG TPA: hypothetical protein VIS06_13760 [Mycobacteriales bacterium]